MDFPSSDAMDVDETPESATTSAPTPRDSHFEDAPDFAPFPLTLSPQRELSSAVLEVDSEPELDVSNAPVRGLFSGFSPAHRGVRRSLHDDSSVSMQRSMSFDSPAQPMHKKRRSFSPEGSNSIIRNRQLALLDPPEHDSLDSSPGLMSSPSVSKLERRQGQVMPPIKALPIHLMQKDEEPVSNVSAKRTRRIALSAMIPPTTLIVEEDLKTARPIMQGDRREEEESKPRRFVPPPVRRAVSAAYPAGIHLMGTVDDTDASESMDSVADISSPAAAYAKRKEVKTIRRCDGTDDFRSITGATAMLKRDNELRAASRKSDEHVPMERDTPRSKYLSAAGARAPGLGGFGDSEANGKILPCHRVKTDGLMRVSWDTVSARCANCLLPKC